jgi:hypothetical protein
VIHGGHDAPVSGLVAFQPVRHQPPRRASLILQELPDEPFGGAGIATFLDEENDHVTVLVDGPQELVPHSSYLHEDLVQVPDVALSALATSEDSAARGPELPTPLLVGLVGDEDSTLRQELLDIARAQTESVLQPNGMTVDFRWEAVAMIAVHFDSHEGSVRKSGSS